MLEKLLVLSPSGPCFIYRKYKETERKTDPQLISAMVALGSSGSVNLSEVTRILRQEAADRGNVDIEISRSHNYISCAISSDVSEKQHIRQILPKVNQLTYETLGNPNNIHKFEDGKIDQTETRIDLLMVKEGLLHAFT